MSVTVKDMMAAANSAVPKVSVAEAQAMVSQEDALLLDVRDGTEVAASGKALGALHISRGLLEFKADAASPIYNAELRKDRPIILYCASGGRSALAGKLLLDMGYARVYNLGGFAGWAEGGGTVEPQS